MAASYKERVEEYIKVITQPKVDVKRLRQLCFYGVPDQPSLRSLTWKLLLDYLPPQREVRNLSKLYSGVLFGWLQNLIVLEGYPTRFSSQY